MKKLVILFCLIAFCIGVGKTLHTAQDGFSSRRIHCLNNEVDEDWDEEIDFALSQPFHYLGRGRQCFAFASEDGKYVLKLPRTDIYKTPFWARVLPVKPYREKLESAHLMRQQFFQGSVDISFNDLQGQTGLIAVHLGKSSSKGKTLVLVDRLGFKHYLPLEKTSFVLQYKRPILMRAFSQALQDGDKEAAKRMIDALIAAVVERAEKGILNKDPSFLRNYGYDGQKAYTIDIGTFIRSPDTVQNSIEYSLNPIKEWLAKTDPEMLDYLKNRKQDL
jgi:hypothetical protein